MGLNLELEKEAGGSDHKIGCENTREVWIPYGGGNSDCEWF